MTKPRRAAADGPKGPRWQFKAHFRAGAYGWKSQPAISRVRQAVTEITKVARKDAAAAGEGAVAFLERLAPAIEGVDGSSGSLGMAVERAIVALAPIIGAAPADVQTRAAWLERLWEALVADSTPWIERLGWHWGEVCGSKEVASGWADRLLPETQWKFDRKAEEFRTFVGDAACLSALNRSGRHEEVLALVEEGSIWHYRRFRVMSLAEQGRIDEAIAESKSTKSQPYTWDNDDAILCEDILLKAGRTEQAYDQYGRLANEGPTYLATFRNIIKKYPQKTPGEILEDLVRRSGNDAGRWFAAAKDAGLLAEALDLARKGPTDPKTLTRAARDWGDEHPDLAVEAAMLALHWIAEGHGFDITFADVLAAREAAIDAAKRSGGAAAVLERIAEITSGNSPNARWIAGSLKRMGM